MAKPWEISPTLERMLRPSSMLESISGRMGQERQEQQQFKNEQIFRAAEGRTAAREIQEERVTLGDVVRETPEFLTDAVDQFASWGAELLKGVSGFGIGQTYRDKVKEDGTPDFDNWSTRDYWHRELDQYVNDANESYQRTRQMVAEQGGPWASIAYGASVGTYKTAWHLASALLTTQAAAKLVPALGAVAKGTFAQNLPHLTSLAAIGALRTPGTMEERLKSGALLAAYSATPFASGPMANYIGGLAKMAPKSADLLAKTIDIGLNIGISSGGLLTGNQYAQAENEAKANASADGADWDRMSALQRWAYRAETWTPIMATDVLFALKTKATPSTRATIDLVSKDQILKPIFDRVASDPGQLRVLANAYNGVYDREGTLDKKIKQAGAQEMDARGRYVSEISFYDKLTASEKPTEQMTPNELRQALTAYRQMYSRGRSPEEAQKLAMETLKYSPVTDPEKKYSPRAEFMFRTADPEKAEARISEMEAARANRAQVDKENSEFQQKYKAGQEVITRHGTDAVKAFTNPRAVKEMMDATGETDLYKLMNMIGVADDRDVYTARYDAELEKLPVEMREDPAAIKRIQKDLAPMMAKDGFDEKQVNAWVKETFAAEVADKPLGADAIIADMKQADDAAKVPEFAKSMAQKAGSGEEWTPEEQQFYANNKDAVEVEMQKLKEASDATGKAAADFKASVDAEVKDGLEPGSPAAARAALNISRIPNGKNADAEAIKQEAYKKLGFETFNKEQLIKTVGMDEAEKAAEEKMSALFSATEAAEAQFRAEYEKEIAANPAAAPERSRIPDSKFIEKATTAIINAAKAAGLKVIRDDAREMARSMATRLEADGVKWKANESTAFEAQEAAKQRVSKATADVEKVVGGIKTTIDGLKDADDSMKSSAIDDNLRRMTLKQRTAFYRTLGVADNVGTYREEEAKIALAKRMGFEYKPENERPAVVAQRANMAEVGSAIRANIKAGEVNSVKEKIVAISFPNEGKIEGDSRTLSELRRLHAEMLGSNSVADFKNSVAELVRFYQGRNASGDADAKTTIDGILSTMVGSAKAVPVGGNIEKAADGRALTEELDANNLTSKQKARLVNYTVEIALKELEKSSDAKIKAFLAGIKKNKAPPDMVYSVLKDYQGDVFARANDSAFARLAAEEGARLAKTSEPQSGMDKDVLRASFSETGRELIDVKYSTDEDVPKGVTKDAAGYFDKDTDKMVILADRVTDIKQAVEFAIGEIKHRGFYGMSQGDRQAFFGKMVKGYPLERYQEQLKTTMRLYGGWDGKGSVIEAFNRLSDAPVKDKAGNVLDASKKAVVLEEMITHMKAEMPTAWNRYVARVMEFVRRAMPGVKLTDSEIKLMVNKAFERGVDATPIGEAIKELYGSYDGAIRQAKKDVEPSEELKDNFSNVLYNYGSRENEVARYIANLLPKRFHSGKANALRGYSTASKSERISKYSGLSISDFYASVLNKELEREMYTNGTKTLFSRLEKGDDFLNVILLGKDVASAIWGKAYHPDLIPEQARSWPEGAKVAVFVEGKTISDLGRGQLPDKFIVERLSNPSEKMLKLGKDDDGVKIVLNQEYSKSLGVGKEDYPPAYARWLAHGSNFEKGANSPKPVKMFDAWTGRFEDETFPASVHSGQFYRALLRLNGGKRPDAQTSYKNSFESVVAEINRFNKEQYDERNKDRFEPFEKIVPNLPEGVKQLTTKAEVQEEGEKMNHCAACYADSAKRGEALFFHIGEGDKGATLALKERQLDRGGKEWVIDNSSHFRGAYNRSPTEAERAIADEIIRIVNEQEQSPSGLRMARVATKPKEYDRKIIDRIRGPVNEIVKQNNNKSDAVKNLTQMMYAFKMRKESTPPVNVVNEASAIVDEGRAVSVNAIKEGKLITGAHHGKDKKVTASNYEDRLFFIAGYDVNGVRASDTRMMLEDVAKYQQQVEFDRNKVSSVEYEIGPNDKGLAMYELPMAEVNGIANAILDGGVVGSNGKSVSGELGDLARQMIADKITDQEFLAGLRSKGYTYIVAHNGTEGDIANKNNIQVAILGKVDGLKIDGNGIPLLRQAINPLQERMTTSQLVAQKYGKFSDALDAMRKAQRAGTFDKAGSIDAFVRLPVPAKESKSFEPPRAAETVKLIGTIKTGLNKLPFRADRRLARLRIGGIPVGQVLDRAVKKLGIGSNPATTLEIASGEAAKEHVNDQREMTHKRNKYLIGFHEKAHNKKAKEEVRKLGLYKLDNNLGKDATGAEIRGTKADRMTMAGLARAAHLKELVAAFKGASGGIEGKSQAVHDAISRIAGGDADTIRDIKQVAYAVFGSGKTNGGDLLFDPTKAREFVFKQGIYDRPYQLNALKILELASGIGAEGERYLDGTFKQTMDYLGGIEKEAYDRQNPEQLKLSKTFYLPLIRVLEKMSPEEKKALGGRIQDPFFIEHVENTSLRGFDRDKTGSLQKRTFSEAPLRIMGIDELMMKHADDVIRYSAGNEIWNKWKAALKANSEDIKQKMGEQAYRDLAQNFMEQEGVVDTSNKVFERAANWMLNRTTKIVLQNPVTWAKQYWSVFSGARAYDAQALAKGMTQFSTPEGRRVISEMRKLSPTMQVRLASNRVETDYMFNQSNYRQQFKQASGTDSWLSKASDKLSSVTARFDRLAVDTLALAAYDYVVRTQPNLKGKALMDAAVREWERGVHETQVSSEAGFMSPLRLSHNPISKMFGYMSGATSAAWNTIARDYNALLRENTPKNRTNLYTSLFTVLMQAMAVTAVGLGAKRLRKGEDEIEDGEYTSGLISNMMSYFPTGSVTGPHLMSVISRARGDTQQAIRLKQGRGQLPHGRFLQDLERAAGFIASGEAEKAAPYMQRVGDFFIGLNTTYWNELLKDTKSN